MTQTKAYSNQVILKDKQINTSLHHATVPPLFVLHIIMHKVPKVKNWWKSPVTAAFIKNMSTLKCISSYIIILKIWSPVKAHPERILESNQPFINLLLNKFMEKNNARLKQHNRFSLKRSFYMSQTKIACISQSHCVV